MEFDTEEGDTVTAQRRTRWRKAVEAGCQHPPAREVAKAVEAGCRRQETVDGGQEPVKVDEEGRPGLKEPERREGQRCVSLNPPSI